MALWACIFDHEYLEYEFDRMMHLCALYFPSVLTVLCSSLKPNPMISGISNEHAQQAASATLPGEMYSMSEMHQDR